ncbi:MAG: DUF167 domain-containing protein [Phycisphaeraceae bacterium]|nr:DUF167 domain-containing protein [Phycisphaeraceae bacterium]
MLLRVKAVPGSSRSAIAGRLGDRLKVRVSAPPEGGRANRAIRELLAEALGIAPAAVEVVSGHARAEKVVRIAGIEPERIEALARE